MSLFKVASTMTLEEKVGQMLLGYQWDIHRTTRTLGAAPESLRTKEESKRKVNFFKDKFDYYNITLN